MNSGETSIGLWGPALSGKTVYLGMLYYVANMIYPGWKMLPTGEKRREAGEWARSIHTTMVGLRVFPGETTTRESRCFELTGYGDFSYGRLHAGLTFTDIPGEQVFTPDPYPELAQCQGILCFIDPKPDFAGIYRRRIDAGHKPPYESVSAFYENALQELFGRLREQVSSQGLTEKIEADWNHRLLYYFCFVISKIDAHKSLWKSRHLPESLAEQIIGEKARSLIDKQCKYVHFDACSAIGPLLDRGQYRGPNCKKVTSGQWVIVDTKNMQPFNLLGPVQWLMERFKVARLCTP